MNLADVKKDDTIRLKHSRKGTVQIKVLSNDGNGWLSGLVVNKKVEGMVNSWDVGEELNMNTNLISNIEKL